jgi:hypothetical protein
VVRLLNLVLRRLNLLRFPGYTASQLQQIDVPQQMPAVILVCARRQVEVVTFLLSRATVPLVCLDRLKVGLTMLSEMLHVCIVCAMVFVVETARGSLYGVLSVRS